MKTVADILAVKGAQVWSIEVHAPLLEALLALADHNVGALLVRDAGKPVGILSERDIVRGMIDENRALNDILVGELMTHRVVYVEPTHTLEECMALMTDKRIRHLPVFRHDELIGMISIGDIVKGTIDEKEFLISQLENYITGR